MSDIHPAARAGYQARAATYERGRPGYPPDVAGWLRDTIGLAPGKTVLELGAGSGKFTPNLVATGAEVIAVEPVDAMRERLAAANPGVRAISGTAEAVPLADSSVDAIVCAQAFHWFANARALAEMRRVLRVGGMLGLIWNVRDESVDWVAALSRITDPLEGDAPRYHDGTWRRLFPAEGFGPLGDQRFTQRHVGDPEDVIVGRTLSVSFIAALPLAEQQKVATHVRALIAATPALAGKSEVAFPYDTLAYACRRIS